MARSKSTGRKPKTPTEKQNEVKAGRVEKPVQVSTKDKSALKVAAKQTPDVLQNKQNKRPISKKKRREIKAARESLASGEIASEDQMRRKERDTRTLYIRFKDKQKTPENLDEVKNLHKDIQVARVPRQSQKKIKYAYVEFGTEAKLEDAKVSIEKNDNLYVDYVGIKSKGGGKPKHQRGGKGKNVKQINPTRLFITGLIDGMTEEKLKLLFPKCCKANIPKGSVRKGTLYGFVQFTNPADAKSAFEAAKKLTVQTKEGKGGQRITVLYATATKHPLPKKNENDAENPKKQDNEKENKSNNTINSKNEVKETKDEQAQNVGDIETDNGVENTKESKTEVKVVKTSNATKDTEEESEDNTDSDDDEDMENDVDSEEEDTNSSKNSKEAKKDVKSKSDSVESEEESGDTDDEDMEGEEESADEEESVDGGENQSNANDQVEDESESSGESDE